MATATRRKKHGQDPNEKRQHLRATVRRRKALAGPARPFRDEPDTVPYERGSAGDRSRRGAT